MSHHDPHTPLDVRRQVSAVFNIALLSLEDLLNILPLALPARLFHSNHKGLEER